MFRLFLVYNSNNGSSPIPSDAVDMRTVKGAGQAIIITGQNASGGDVGTWLEQGPTAAGPWSRLSPDVAVVVADNTDPGMFLLDYTRSQRFIRMNSDGGMSVDLAVVESRPPLSLTGR